MFYQNIFLHITTTSSMFSQLLQVVVINLNLFKTRQMHTVNISCSSALSENLTKSDHDVSELGLGRCLLELLELHGQSHVPLHLKVFNFISLHSTSMIFLLLLSRSFDWSEKELLWPRARNRFQGIDSARLCSLAGRYDNLIPTRFLAPIDCLKIPALLWPWILSIYIGR